MTTDTREQLRPLIELANTAAHHLRMAAIQRSEDIGPDLAQRIADLSQLAHDVFTVLWAAPDTPQEDTHE